MSALEIFQQKITEILQGLQGVTSYMDDIIGYTKDTVLAIPVFIGSLQWPVIVLNRRTVETVICSPRSS